MAGQQQQGQGDNSMGVLWIVIAIFVFGGLLWYLERGIIYFKFRFDKVTN